mgnify:CR=1 FL=1
MENKSEERLLDFQAVRDRVSLGRATVQRMINRGDFPAPLHFGRNVARWRSSDIDRWIADAHLIRSLPRGKAVRA